MENFAMAYMNRGANTYQMRDAKKALEDYDKCISIREHLQNNGVEQDIFDVFMAYKNRAIAYETLDNTKAAIGDNIFALRALKGEISHQYELKEIYFECLGETLEMINREGDKALYDSVSREFNN